MSEENELEKLSREFEEEDKQPATQSKRQEVCLSYVRRINRASNLLHYNKLVGPFCRWCEEVETDDFDWDELYEELCP